MPLGNTGTLSDARDGARPRRPRATRQLGTESVVGGPTGQATSTIRASGRSGLGGPVQMVGWSW